MSTTSQNTDLDDVFRAIADPTRRLILDQLRVEPLNTTALCAANDSMTRGGVINHIKILEAAELIRVEERGRERINHLNAARLQDVYDRWLTPFEQVSSARLGHLTHIAETITTTAQEATMPNPPVRAVEIIQQRTCNATPAAVWEALTTKVDQWWTPPYLDDSSQSLTLHLEPGGTLWDARSETSGYTLAIVRGYTPEHELILDGEFGLPGALAGRLVIDITQIDTAITSVTFTNTALGPIPANVDANEKGWGILLHQLCVNAEQADP